MEGITGGLVVNSSAIVPAFRRGNAPVDFTVPPHVAAKILDKNPHCISLFFKIRQLFFTGGNTYENRLVARISCRRGDAD